MKKKLYRNTFKFMCSNCGEFFHTVYEYCEKCGAQGTVHNTVKKDYK